MGPEQGSGEAEKVTRSAPHDGFEPPAWWRPWKETSSLMAQTRATIEAYGDAPYMTWLDERGREAGTMTFEGVWAASGVIARRMKEEWGVELGDRVLLCYLPGTAFIVAYWACLRLRAIAVPAYPPDPSKLEIGLKKLALVAKSCAARLCLTERTLEQMRVALSLTHTWPEGLVWKRTDDVPVKKRRATRVDESLDAPDDRPSVAFLQYTSGSTGDPKGVMLTFDNIWHNINEMYLPGQLRHLAQRGLTHEWGVTEERSGRRAVGVSWLPQFHDTGLVLCIVAPFVAGYRMINFSPLTFLRLPLLWMETLTKYGAHWSAAPDFSYELCVRRLGESGSPPAIDLSTVRQLACGAGERCRPVQLARFLETFSKFGLRRDVYVPNYGLAEHVVGTSGCARGVVLSTARPDLACCGEDFQTDVRIVCPATRVEKPLGEPGEIWLSSRSVAAGYWGRPDLTRDAFEARLAASRDGCAHCYLRTGDEGYFEDGPLGPQLFICGRIKDVIIVGGKNYFPEDIEVAAQEADRDNIRPGCVAAFAAQDGGTADGDETVTCVFELRRKALPLFDTQPKLAALADDVRRAVGVASGLLPARLVVIAERTIPKTTSGKVQRRQTRTLLNSRGLTVHYDSAGDHPTLSEKRSATSFSAWLADSIDSALSCLTDRAPPTVPTPSGNAQHHPPDHHPTQPPADSADVAPSETRDVVEDEEVAATARVIVAAIRDIASGPCTPSTAFHELGLSSRQTIEVLRRVERDVDVELPPSLVFSCPTVAALAAEICKLRRGDALNASTPSHSSPPAARAPGPLAILSVSARLPGDCDSVSRDLRQIVSARLETSATVPVDRWDVDAVDLSRAHSAARSRASYGAFCRGAEGFDPANFGMRPAEAAALDPQQRLFLVRAYDALAAAGYSHHRGDENNGDFSSSPTLFAGSVDTQPRTIKTRPTIPLAGSNVAVALGMMNMDVAFSLEPTSVGPHDLTGNGYSSAGSRLSFLFDMRGPCIVVDTACSASLVAGHACSRFVSSGEAEAGLFAGTSLMLAPSFVHIGAAVAAMTSETGRCHTFDSAADGYCRGEGCAVVIIGPGDETSDLFEPSFRAVGFAVKHNGQSATFTALNSSAQTRLMEGTPGGRATSAVEAHGTGTKLGDPIEVAGLASLKKVIEPSMRTLVTGVKANIGHTEPTAGVSGYLAALLVAVCAEPQPSARLRVANPVARFDNLDQLAPATDTTPWCSNLTRTFSVGVSSFGYSGIIAHAVLDARADEFVDNESLPTMVNGKSKVVVMRRRRLPQNQPKLPVSRHAWLLRKPTTAEDDVVAFTIKPAAHIALADELSASSHLVEIALAVAHAVGATVLTDISLVATGEKATRCVVEGDEVRVEADDGAPLLTACVTEADVAPKHLRRCVLAKPPIKLTPSVLLREEVDVAWVLAKGEARGLVVRRPLRMYSPTLRAAAVEATRQLASVLACRDVEWLSIDEIHLMPNLDDDQNASRAWARVVTRSTSAEQIIVDCDVKTSSPFIALRGAAVQRRGVAPARIEDAAVLELGWRESLKPESTQQEHSTVTVVSRSPHIVRPGSDTFPVIDAAHFRPGSEVLAIVSPEEHVAHAWSRLPTASPAVLPPQSLPRKLQAAGLQDITVTSAWAPHTYAPRQHVLETQIIVADADAYRQKSSPPRSTINRPTLILELSSNHLLPLAARAFGEMLDIVIVNDTCLSSPVASELAVLFSKHRPAILVGQSGDPVPLWLYESGRTTAEEVRVSLRHDATSTHVDSSRVSTTVYIGLTPQFAWLAQQRRLMGCCSLAQVGPMAATSNHAGIVAACARGARMVAWAAAIVTPSFDLRRSLVPRISAAAPRGTKRANSHSTKGRRTVSIQSVVKDVVGRILGPEALTTPFAELGIDSLQGTEVAHELGNQLGREVSPTVFLEATDVGNLVAALGGDVEKLEHSNNVPRAEVESDNNSTAMSGPARILPASVKCAESTPDQELLFWMSRHQEHFTWLPVTAVGDLVGDLDVEALKRAVDCVVSRHEALRSRLVRVQIDSEHSRTLLIVDDDLSRYPSLEIRDAANAAAARREAQAFHDEYDNNAFAACAPFRALLVRYPATANGEHGSSNGMRRQLPLTNGVLYVSTNHAVSDGWSQQLLYVDLVAAYNNNGVLPSDQAEPARRYCDFLTWHNEEVAMLSHSEAVAAQRRQYAEATRLPTRLPTECAPDAIADTLFDTGSLLHSDLVAVVEASRVAAVESRLQGAAADLGRASLPSALLAAYLTALGDAQTGNTVVIQYSHTGRIGHAELAETYGQLASDMNVVVPAVETLRLGAFIANVHAAVVHSLSLASVPYSLAYRASSTKRKPLPPQFNWYDRYSDVPQWRGLEAKEIAIDQAQMRYRTFNIGAIYLMGLVQSDGSLMLKLFYNRHVYSRATVELVMDRMTSFLNVFAVQGPVAPVPRFD